MIALEDAQARLLALAAPLDIEEVPLAEAPGRWAAQAVVARRTQPARHLSAMDGYAIRHADLPGPWRVIGESVAGSRFPGQLRAGEAARIFTGAALPEGADAILIQENAARDGETLALTAEAPALDQHVRAAGSDFALDDALIGAGALLTPARIALAALGGHGTLAVRRRARVALLSTGDELVPPGTDPGADRLPASNAVMIAAQLAGLPVDVTDLGIAADDRDALAAALQRARTADLVVTTGGASVGDHDLVRPALLAAGAAIDFWKVAMRPGKPLMAGRLGDALVLGLPGNPVSAFVTTELFVKPLLRALAGAAEPFAPRGDALLSAPLPATGPRADHVRAILDRGRVAPVGVNDSAATLALARANALIVRAAGAPAASPGERVEIIALA